MIRGISYGFLNAHLQEDYPSDFEEEEEEIETANDEENDTPAEPLQKSASENEDEDEEEESEAVSEKEQIETSNVQTGFFRKSSAIRRDKGNLSEAN